ncbi:hypothetical protein EOD39_10501 [Acipenser ruthenus]|uniref:Uncharacterized protein n=1 Tax=Acipenser ruthenus TaxID=7906 RepID=A0A444TXU2_ACIRT|nr:hypothetical protein EOD39_10501 [Acipenser ruthenus]
MPLPLDVQPVVATLAAEMLTAVKFTPDVALVLAAAMLLSARDTAAVAVSLRTPAVMELGAEMLPSVRDPLAMAAVMGTPDSSAQPPAELNQTQARPRPSRYRPKRIQLELPQATQVLLDIQQPPAEQQAPPSIAEGAPAQSTTGETAAPAGERTPSPQCCQLGD